MIVNIAYPRNATQKIWKLDDEKVFSKFYDKKIGQEVDADFIAPEFKGYRVQITGGSDKNGFCMKQGVNTKNLVKLLRTINHRIEKLLDRDHCIGHAYFLGLKAEPTLLALKRVFRNKVLPLLQEHFFGDWGKIGLVLGERFVVRKEGGAKILADFKHDDREILEERATWRVEKIDDRTDADFRAIYAHAS